jgi:threonine 3-dehydrogenase
MYGLFNVLEVARELSIKQVICPSSIAAFGPDTPKDNTPNETILRPTSMYGVTKVAGELLGNYYVKKYGLDVRGMRFPGIISYKTLPGGGTTDYAVAIYYEALRKKEYTYFVREDTVLPMMYMPDAIKSLIKITEVDKTLSCPGIPPKDLYRASSSSLSCPPCSGILPRAFKVAL